MYSNNSIFPSLQEKKVFEIRNYTKKILIFRVLINLNELKQKKN